MIFNIWSVWLLFFANFFFQSMNSQQWFHRGILQIVFPWKRLLIDSDPFFGYYCTLIFLCWITVIWLKIAVNVWNSQFQNHKTFFTIPGTSCFRSKLIIRKKISWNQLKHIFYTLLSFTPYFSCSITSQENG